MYLPRTQDPPSSPNGASGIENMSTTGKKHKEGYINLNAPYQHLAAGQWVTIASPWHMSIPILAKIRSVIPVGKPAPTSCPQEVKKEFPSLVPDDY
jgi:hypothetical protein